MRTSQRRFFDILALLFLTAHLFFLVGNWERYPTELDTSYHLLMGKMFVEKGGVPAWDDYEFAPVGRPHLYPPLQHILVWVLRGLTGLPYVDIGRLIAVSQGFLTLLSVWFFSRRFFNPGVGLFALVLLASHTEMWWWQTSVAPVALITVLFLPFVYLYYKKKLVLPIFILTACFYLHYGLSMVAVLTVLIATLSYRRYRAGYLKNLIVVFGASALLFTPWLLRMFQFRGYFMRTFQDERLLDLFSFTILFREVFLYLNGVAWLFLPFGFYYCYLRRTKDFKYALLLAGFLSFFVFLFLFNGVRFIAHSSLAVSVLSGLGVFLCLRRVEHLGSPLVRAALRSAIVFLVVVSLFIELHFLTLGLLKLNEDSIGFMGLETSEVFLRPTPLSREVTSLVSKTPLRGKHAVRVQHFFHEQDTSDLLEYIRRSIPEETVLHIFNGAIADYITLQTGRRTDCGMFFEVIPEGLSRAMASNLRNGGYYVSTSSIFEELGPFGPHGSGRRPKIIRRVGKFYVGYLAPDPSKSAEP